MESIGERVRESAEFTISIVLTTVSLIVSVLVYFVLPPQIPLWYSLAVLDQQLAPKLFIGIFPLFMVVLVLVHGIVLKWFDSLDEGFKKMLGLSTLFVVIMALIAQGRVILLSL